MKPVAELVVEDSWQTTVLSQPKKFLNAEAVAFCDGKPVGRSDAGPLWWPEGVHKKPHPIEIEGFKRLTVFHAKDRQMVGLDERAGPILITFHQTGSFSHAHLHPPGYEKSLAIRCGEGRQVGSGHPKNDPDGFHALCWSGSAESVVALRAPQAGAGCSAVAVERGLEAGSWNAGRFNGVLVKHACLWHGSSETFADLNPPASNSSMINAVGDGEQAGEFFFGEYLSGPHAGLWRGTAESFIDLTPTGFGIARARACVGGFQIGMIMEKARFFSRAVVWSGAAEGYFELHKLLPGEWNWSEAVEIEVAGDVLRIIGNARQGILHERRPEVVRHAAQAVVVWEARLREPYVRPESFTGTQREQALGRLSAPEIASPSGAKAEYGPPDERCAAAFGDAVVESNFNAAASLLAPWLHKTFPPAKLKKFVLDAMIEGAPEAGGVDVHRGSAHLQDLRKIRTIPEDIKLENFRGWVCLQFVPGPDEETDFDFCYQLWVIVVELAEGMKVGYLEVNNDS
jgi:hypothetical protein